MKQLHFFKKNAMSEPMLLAEAVRRAVGVWSEGQAIGFNIIEQAERSDSVTCVLTNGHDPEALRAYCNKQCGVILGHGIGELSGKAFRGPGLADGLATGLRSGLGPLAVLATPLFAAAFGFLTGSSNAANGLLMPAQIALARDAALSLPWLGAIQNTAAAALTMLSPVRVAVGCALVGKPDLERTVYLRGWPLGAVPLAILVGAAALLLVH